jgi:hypothetical protein
MKHYKTEVITGNKRYTNCSCFHVRSMCIFEGHPSGIWCHVVLYKESDISGDQRQYAPLKRWSAYKSLHGTISQKTVIFMLQRFQTVGHHPWGGAVGPWGGGANLFVKEHICFE